TPYHLLMGKMFSDYGKVCLWDYYEYAPVGRPNLYPPLLHVLVWWIHAATGLDFISVGRLITVVQYPLSLASLYLVSRRLFSSRLALIAALLLSSSTHFWMWQVTVAPTALALILYPPLAYCLLARRRVTTGLLLAAVLYLHLGIPLVFFACLLLQAAILHAYGESLWRDLAASAALALALYLPWGLHVAANLEYLSMVRRFKAIGLVATALSASTLLLALTPVGVALSVALTGERRGYSIPASAPVGFTLIALTYGSRYILHSPMVNALAAAVVLDKVAERRRLAAVAALALALGSALCEPSVLMLTGAGGALWEVAGGRRCKSPLLAELALASGADIRDPWGFSLNDPALIELSEWIAANIPEEEVLHVPMGPLADYITLTTGRLTDSGMYREVGGTELQRAVREGRKSGVFVLTARQAELVLRAPGARVIAEFGKYIVAEVRHETPEVELSWVALSLQALEHLELPATHVEVHIATTQEAVREALELASRLSAVLEVKVSDWASIPELLREADAMGVQVILFITPGTPSPPAEVLEQLSSLRYKVGVAGPPISAPDWSRQLKKLAQSREVVRHIPPTGEAARLIEEDSKLLKITGVQVDLKSPPPAYVLKPLLARLAGMGLKVGVGVRELTPELESLLLKLLG
ncbi:MAG: hypothetical protein DRN99_08405, partial [Thermoproteota archaeon]